MTNKLIDAFDSALEHDKDSFSAVISAALDAKAMDALSNFAVSEEEVSDIVEYEQLDEVQHLEITNAITGAKKYIKVAPDKAFAALNQYKALKNSDGKPQNKSVRIVHKTKMDESLEVVDFEEAEQLDELSKDTLKSYLKKAPATLYSKGMENGKKHAQADEIDRFTNRNGGLGGYKVGDELKSKAGVDSKETEKIRSKAFLRNKSIGKAVDKLTK